MEGQPPKTINNKIFSTQSLPLSVGKKVQGLVNVLNEQIINLKKLKALLGEGIPDEAGIIRQYAWKVILGYLGEDKTKWQEKADKQTKTYNEFVDLFLPPHRFPNYPMQINKKHQLWKQLEEQFYLWQQIEKDTSRTHAQLSFFCTKAQPIMIPFLTSPRKEKFRLIYGQQQQAYKQFLEDKESQRKTYRYDYMTRILYIYAKLNPKVQYVQGMNQILAPIFYLVNAPKSSQQPIDEAACFFMFNNAISEIIQLHIKDLDKSQNGIYGKLNQVNQMLVVIEPRIWSRLEALKINPFFYCFRWMTLLFAQQFQLFDVLRIWQSIFSAESRLDYMSYFAISIIVSQKNFILNNEFVPVLQHLQNISETINLQASLKLANQLYTQFKNYDFKQHSQITKQALNKAQKQKQKQKKGWGSKLIDKMNKIIE